MNIQFVGCHKRADRSFFWKGKQFPVCARCTGIYLGYLSFPVFNFDLLHFTNLMGLLLILPTILDGVTQAFFSRESTNLLRLSTGIMAGVGAMSLIVNFGTFLGHIILN